MELKVLAARNLASKDSNGFSDPYAVVCLASNKSTPWIKTRVVPKSLAPDWSLDDESVGTMDLPSLEDHVLVRVWDRDRVSSDDFLGACSLSLKTISQGESIAWFPLAFDEDFDDETNADVQGEVQLRIFLTSLQVEGSPRSTIRVSRRDVPSTPNTKIFRTTLPASCWLQSNVEHRMSARLSGVNVPPSAIREVYVRPQPDVTALEGERLQAYECAVRACIDPISETLTTHQLPVTFSELARKKIGLCYLATKGYFGYQYHVGKPVTTKQLKDIQDRFTAALSTTDLAAKDSYTLALMRWYSTCLMRDAEGMVEEAACFLEDLERIFRNTLLAELQLASPSGGDRDDVDVHVDVQQRTLTAHMDLFRRLLWNQHVDPAALPQQLDRPVGDAQFGEAALLDFLAHTFSAPRDVHQAIVLESQQAKAEGALVRLMRGRLEAAGYTPYHSRTSFACLDDYTRFVEAEREMASRLVNVASARTDEVSTEGRGPRGVLTVGIIEGRELAPMDKTGLSDPYCVFYLNTALERKKKIPSGYRTATVSQTLNPSWRMEGTLDVAQADTALVIECWDEDAVSSMLGKFVKKPGGGKPQKDDWLGQIILPLDTVEPNITMETWYPLEQGDVKGDYVTGGLKVRLRFATDCEGARWRSLDRVSLTRTLLAVLFLRDASTCAPAPFSGLSPQSAALLAECSERYGVPPVTQQIFYFSEVAEYCKNDGNIDVVALLEFYVAFAQMLEDARSSVAMCGAVPVHVEETYQYQRRYPLKGWSDGLLPTDMPQWSSRTFKARRREDVLLPEGWKWTSEWYTDGSFMYSHFSRGRYSNATPTKITHVRRRRWVRECAPVEESTDARPFSTPLTLRDEELLALASTCAAEALEGRVRLYRSFFPQNMPEDSLASAITLLSLLKGKESTHEEYVEIIVSQAREVYDQLVRQVEKRFPEEAPPPVESVPHPEGRTHEGTASAGTARVLRAGELCRLVGEAIDEECYFEFVFPIDASHLSIVVAEYCCLLVSDLSRAMQESADCPMDTKLLTFEIVISFNGEMARRVGDAFAPVPVAALFRDMVHDWLDSTRLKLTRWVERSVAAEEWQPLSESLLHSSSVADVFAAVDQAVAWVHKLEWPERDEHTAFMKAVAGIASDVAEMYAAAVRDAARSTAQMAPDVSADDADDADEDARSKHLMRLCVMASTASAARSSLDSLVRTAEEYLGSEAGWVRACEAGFSSLRKCRDSVVRRVVGSVWADAEPFIAMMVAGQEPGSFFKRIRRREKSQRKRKEESLASDNDIGEQLSALLDALDSNLEIVADLTYSHVFQRVLRGLWEASVDTLFVNITPGQGTKALSMYSRTVTIKVLSSLVFFFHADGEGLAMKSINDDIVCIHTALNLWDAETEDIIAMHAAPQTKARFTTDVLVSYLRVRKRDTRAADFVRDHS